MNGEAPQVYTVGEGFVENPGCHHIVGENNSNSSPAKLFAVFIVDTEVVRRGYDCLTVTDEGW